MRLRYRVLKRRFDEAAFLADWNAQMVQEKNNLEQHAWTLLRHGRFRRLLLLPISSGIRLLGILEVLVLDARQVEATELEASESELQQQLLTGRLKATDLVLIDGGWQSFSDTALFEDTCAEAEHRNRWWNRLSWAFAMALGFALAAGIVWVIFSIPGWVFSRD